MIAMMVLMAIVTTFATGPLLSLSDRWRAEPERVAVAGAS